jgi:hypothetical protein
VAKKLHFHEILTLISRVRAASPFIYPLCGSWEEEVRTSTQKRIAYFIITGAVGGLVIGLVASTNVSPVLAGILGALVILLIFIGTIFLREKNIVMSDCVFTKKTYANTDIRMCAHGEKFLLQTLNQIEH